MDTIGARIRELREKTPLKQRDVALKVGVEPGSYGNWERGKREISLSSVYEINEVLKQYLGDNIFYLLTGKKPEEYLTAFNISSQYISKEVVLAKTQDFLSDMDIQRDIRLIAKLDDLMKAYAQFVIVENARERADEDCQENGTL